jgi:ankyrin repeat protein
VRRRTSGCTGARAAETVFFGRRRRAGPVNLDVMRPGVNRAVLIQMQKEPYPLQDAVLRVDVIATSQLIDAGVDLNELDEYGKTALHWAVWTGCYELVELHVRAGADLNIKTRDFATALWYAEDDFGMDEIAALLRAHGATK